MHSPLPLPVTLLTACLLSLIYVVLFARVVLARVRLRISLGDGGNPDMLARMRAHANFSEYVPLILILMGILELSKVNPIMLMVAGALLVIFRIMHALGVPQAPPNALRTVGAAGTALILVCLAIGGLVLVITA